MKMSKKKKLYFLLYLFSLQKFDCKRSNLFFAAELHANFFPNCERRRKLKRFVTSIGIFLIYQAAAGFQFYDYT